MLGIIQHIVKHAMRLSAKPGPIRRIKRVAIYDRGDCSNGLSGEAVSRCEVSDVVDMTNANSIVGMGEKLQWDADSRRSWPQCCST